MQQVSWQYFHVLRRLHCDCLIRQQSILHPTRRYTLSFKRRLSRLPAPMVYFAIKMPFLTLHTHPDARFCQSISRAQRMILIILYKFLQTGKVHALFYIVFTPPLEDFKMLRFVLYLNWNNKTHFKEIDVDLNSKINLRFE